MATAAGGTAAARQGGGASRSAPPTTAAAPAGTGAERHKAVLQQYCIGCHNDRSQAAGLTLDQLDINNVAAHADTWEKVARKLRTGAMPPAGLPRPDAAGLASPR